MLRPTNDPLEVMRRAAADSARATREALGASGTQSYQAVAKIQAQIEAVQALVLRLPQVAGAQQDATGFGLSDVSSGEWKTVVTATVAKPDEVNRVVVSAAGYASVLDMTSFGATSAAMRLVINGTASKTLTAAKDAGASVVANVMNGSFVREISPAPLMVTVQLQVSPLNPAAFTAQESNTATLTLYCGFTVV